MEFLIDKLFSHMDDWRNLPAYQLERRADIFFSIYLEEIIKSKYGQTIKPVIPEFPVRAGDVVENHKRPDLSFKIDYVAVSEDDKYVFLIELKTDQSSRRSEQDDYLNKAQKNNVRKLIDGIIKIYKATDSKYIKKYDYLISKLSQLGWIKKENLQLINTAKDYKIIIVFIQPRNDDNSPDTISFNDICSILKGQDDLTKRFAKSLGNWVKNPSDTAVGV